MGVAGPAGGIRAPCLKDPRPEMLDELQMSPRKQKGRVVDPPRVKCQRMAITSLLEQFPFLIAAAVGGFLVHLGAGGCAGTGIAEHEAAVGVGFPLVVAGGAEGPLDDFGAGRGGSALDDGVLAALGAIDLVIAAGGGDEGPIEI